MTAYSLPARSVVSFSGGRTSGLMLWNILDAHGGTLPDDIRVVFCNTGRERPETLDFVERCSLEWGVPVTWLEYVATPSGKFRKRDGKSLWCHTFREVNYATASRNGEPFDLAIKTRGDYLPNPVTRYCTGELKIKTTNRYVLRALGWELYANAIGFRADEPDRVANILGAHKQAQKQPWLFPDLEDEGEEEADKKWKVVKGETPLCPLFDAGVTRDGVMDFWARQSFDLQLQPHEGNCDGCFLKGARKLLRTFADRPDLADWWISQEERIANQGRCRKSEMARFRADRPSYRELQMLATGQPLPGEFDFGPPDPSPDGRTCALWDDCRCTD